MGFAAQRVRKPDGVVDEGGYIVTVDLVEGRVVGVQREKGAYFNGCSIVDGRLLVSGMVDGTLWRYEPSAARTRQAKSSDSRRSEPDPKRPANVSKRAFMCADPPGGFGHGPRLSRPGPTG